MDKNLIEKGIRATKSLIVFKVAGEIVSLGVTIFLVRYLTVNYYGIYNLLYSTIGLIVAFASLGLNDTLNRYIPEYYQRGEFVLANKLYRTASLLRFITNIVIIVLIFGLWDIFAPALKIGGYREYYVYFIPVIILFTQWGLINICLNAYFLQKYTQLLYIIFMMLKGIGYSIVFALKLDLKAIIIVDAVSFLILVGILQFVYIKKIPLQGASAYFTPQERKRILRYSFFNNFNDLGVQLLDVNIDNFILIYFLNPAAVGAYSFCNRIAKLIGRFIPTYYLIDVIKPLFFSAYSTNKEDSTRFYQFLIKITYLFYAQLFIIFTVFGKEIIKIISGGKFVEYKNSLLLVIFFQMLSAFQLSLGLVAQLNERAEIILYSKIFGIYNLIADIIMIKWWGVMGAVIATGTAILFKNIFIWWFVRKEASFKGLSSFSILLILYLVASIFMLSVVKQHINKIFTIAVYFLFLTIYWMIMKGHLLTNGERQTLRKLAPQNLSYLI